MEKVKLLRCDKCGNLVDMLNDSGVDPVCCGQPMRRLKANSTDGAGEKHVPVIERDGDKIKVKVGSVTHPMEDAHYIEWIAIEQQKKVQRKWLKPGELPEATFVVCNDEKIVAYEYCNLHGLWKAEG